MPIPSSTMRGKVVRIDPDGSPWVEVFDLGVNYTFGPCQRSTNAPLAIDDRVIVSTVSGTLEDIVVVGPLNPPPQESSIPDGSITDVQIAAANKDGLAATPSLRTLGTGAQQAAAGNDPRLSDARTPLAHTHAAADVTSGTFVIARLPVATSGTSNTTQVVRADDSRLSNSRTPSGTAGGDLAGSYPNPTIGTGKVVFTHLASAAVAASGVSSSTALVRADDSRLSDARTPTTHTHTTAQVTNLDNILGAKADLVGGVIPTNQLPPLAINETYVVTSQAAMLALTAQRGDMAVRTDQGRTYVLASDNPTTLADWKEMLAAGQVTSVNGQQGAVNLTKSDVGLANVQNVDQTNAANLTTGTVALARLPVAASGVSSSTLLVRADDSRLSDARTPVAHVHATADVTSGTFDIARLPVATSGTSSATQVVRADDSRLSNARTPVAHTHSGADITSGTVAIAYLPVAASGTSNTTQVVRADDSRLSNARTPVAHTHTKADITDFAHTHAIADLPVAADGVSSSTALVRADDVRLSNNRTPVAHFHATSDVTSGTFDIARLPVATSGTSNTTQVVRADDSRLSNARTPTAHTHGASDINSGTLDIARLPVATSGTSNTTQVVRADDSRLSNARTPTAHTHGVADLTATGTRDSTTFLRGDNTWATITVGTHTHDDRYFTESEADARYINVVENGTGTFRRARGALKWEQSGANLAGDLVIQTNLPFTNRMVRFHITGYNYVFSTNNIDLMIGAYLNDNAGTPRWFNFGGVDNGDVPISQVRLMRRTSDNRAAIVITTTAGNWQYPKIAVDVIGGHSAGNDTELTTGWSASITTDLTAYTAMETCPITSSYSKTATDTLLAGKAATVHGHALTDANITGTVPDARLPARLKAGAANNSAAFDAATESGVYYCGNNPNVLPGTDSTATPDVAVHVTAYSDQWLVQTALDWRTNRRWTRNRANGVWGSWVEIVRTTEGDTRYLLANTTPSALWRAQSNITGGGTISVTSGGGVSWSARFIVISNGRGSYFSTAGYFDLNMPPNGTVITGVGGVGNQTVAGGVITLSVWQALYYILPTGSGNVTVNTNYRIANYTSDVTIPDNWILIAVRNGDSGGAVRMCTGVIISLGGTSTQNDPYPQYNSLGTDNTSVVQRKAIIQETDTRNTVHNYTNGVLTSIQERNGTTVIKTTTMNYTAGDLTSIVEVAGGVTVTTTLVYTNGVVTSTTKTVT